MPYQQVLSLSLLAWACRKQIDRAERLLAASSGDVEHARRVAEVVEAAERRPGNWSPLIGRYGKVVEL